MNIQSGEQVEQVTDHLSRNGVKVVPLDSQLSRKQKKRFIEFLRALQKNEEYQDRAISLFKIWFMRAHDISHPPEPLTEFGEIDPYVSMLYMTWLQVGVFQSTKLASSLLEIENDPEVRKMYGMPLKYQHTDMLEAV